MSWPLIRHGDATALADALAQRIGAAIDVALSERGQALLALAGGRTAPPVLRRVAAQARDWTQITVLPSDERWVPFAHEDCNLRQMQQAFGASAAAIHWISLTPECPEGPAAAEHAQTALARLPQAIDLCLLGMGADGHFASLFPGAPNLSQGLDPNGSADAIAIEPDPMPSAGPHPRVTLTLARLLRSRNLLLAITGSDKLALLEVARQPNSPLPIAALLRARHPNAEIHWSP